MIGDGDDVFLRCEVCGLTCPLPPDIRPSPVHEFVRQHQVEVDALMHPAECPAWGMTSSSSR